MSVPASTTTLNFNGVYTKNKALSNDASTGAMLAAQGIPEAFVQVLTVANIIMTMKHITENGIETLEAEYKHDIGAVDSVRECLVLGGPERASEGPLFGKVVVSAERVMPKDVQEPSFVGSWDKDTEESGIVVFTGRGAGEVAWKSKMAQGFQDFSGDRHLVRRITFTGAMGEKYETSVVFDYQGPIN